MKSSVKLIVGVSCLLILSACNKDDKGDKTGKELRASNIVGGTVADEAFQKANGIVSLVISTDAGSGICTGTLIAKRVVLTAAHCLDSGMRQIKSVAVVFAPNVATATREQVRFGIKGLSHEDFQKDLFSGNAQASWNDIALLRLNEDAPADFKFVRLTRPELLDALTTSTDIIQAGFGKTQPGRQPSPEDKSGVLRHVDTIKILGLAPDTKELYMKEENQGSCNGDSGGPAYVREADGSLTQIGLNSRGTDPASCVGVGIYTNLAAHLTWITEKSEILMAVVIPSTPPSVASGTVTAE